MSREILKKPDTSHALTAPEIAAIMSANNEDPDSPSEESNDFASYFCNISGKELQIFKADKLEIRKSHFVEVDKVRREIIDVLASGGTLSDDKLFWLNSALMQCASLNKTEHDKVFIEMFGELKDYLPKDEKTDEERYIKSSNFGAALDSLQKKLKVNFLDTSEKVLEWISQLTEQNILGYRDNFVNRVGDEISSNFLEIYGVWRALQSRSQNSNS